VSRYLVRCRHRVEGQRPGRLRLAESASIAAYAEIDTSADVTIGERVVLSEAVMLLTHDHIRDGKRGLVFSPLAIEADAFVGARAIVLESCHVIGEGAVVGAGAVVTRDVPAGETWAGNPARRIRSACGLCRVTHEPDSKHKETPRGECRRGRGRTGKAVRRAPA
jgi:acetyltransferase-like isoleucine patch superfamily enzyme